MYTVADGPEGIHLTVVMPGSGTYTLCVNKVPLFIYFCLSHAIQTVYILQLYLTDIIPLITEFGIYGDGFEHVIKRKYERGFNVLCGSSVPNTTVYWQRRKNNKSDQDLIVGHFQNGIQYNYVHMIYTNLFPCSYCRYCRASFC